MYRYMYRLIYKMKELGEREVFKGTFSLVSLLAR